ncbi:GNAT family N-acetyltransferase [Shewanella avicenniae]|uniref:GNAT family N-acetyltransferase n=1 Tax=Shewanella avicenniae TaxID=2814294 RepID=A0ABX7QW16_9GAMM|nr:GNAT family N-acetyltransferase [Shewanella avicenniae]QSX34823.1 GNAT family N-acetyltransferase [Shewanella avicenniae]
MPLSYIHYSEKLHRQYIAQIAAIYHQAVHAQSGGFYSQRQCDAWSRAPRSSHFWRLQLRHSQAWLALDGSAQCVGFIQVESGFKDRGYVSCLYVLPRYQRRGIAAALIEQAKQWAREQQWPSLTTDASLQSHTVFSRCGFGLRHKSYQEKCGVQFLGMKMICPLAKG